MSTSFRKLLEISDNAAREELGEYYIISESRMNNYLHCLESGAKELDSLRAENAALREVVEAADKWALAKKKPVSMVDIVLLRSVKGFKEKS